MSLDIRPPTAICTPGSHDWSHNVNDDGDTYEACSVCGKQARWIPA